MGASGFLLSLLSCKWRAALCGERGDGEGFAATETKENAPSSNDRWLEAGGGWRLMLTEADAQWFPQVAATDRGPVEFSPTSSYPPTSRPSLPSSLLPCPFSPHSSLSFPPSLRTASLIS